MFVGRSKPSGLCTSKINLSVLSKLGVEERRQKYHDEILYKFKFKIKFITSSQSQQNKSTLLHRSTYQQLPKRWLRFISIIKFVPSKILRHTRRVSMLNCINWIKKIKLRFESMISNSIQSTSVSCVFDKIWFTSRILHFFYITDFYQIYFGVSQCEGVYSYKYEEKIHWICERSSGDNWAYW